MRALPRSLLALLAATTVVLAPCLAAADAEDEVEISEEEEISEKETALREAYDELLEDAEELDGLLKLWRKAGKLYLELTEETLEKQYLIFPSIARGVGVGRLLGGMMWGPDDVVVKFQRRDDEEVLLLRRNIRFLADEDTPMATAVETSYTDSVVGRLEILGKTEEDAILVRLDPILVSDWVGVREALKESLGRGFSLLGDRSWLSQAKAFERNLEIDAVLSFSSGAPQVADEVADGRGLSLTLHYSLLELPEEGFTPRRADDRVGHFLTARRNHSRTDPEGTMVRYVNRWKLEKADPAAKASTVKEPIVFHLSKTIPYEYRPYVRQGILAWNQAFERVGLLDAIEVRYQGKDEDWDPMDVRYNTIVWTGEAPFSGVGPSRADPRTGQLLDADILYNASAIQNMFRYYPVLVPKTPAAPQMAAPLHPEVCDFQDGFRGELELAALHWLTAQDASAVASGEVRLPREFVGASVRKTIIHEVGHVLGLRHNFKGSSAVPRARLHDADWTRAHGLTASIMDYPAANLAPPGKPQGEYFSSCIGPYDYWAIEYAYSDLGVDHELEDEERQEAEDEALALVAARSAETTLAYATDEDRWTGFHRNLDPFAQAYDLGDDPLGFARERTALVTGLWDHVLERLVTEGDRYTLARYGIRVLIAQLATTTGLALPYIGGQVHHRDHKGDPGERPSFVPVEAAVQRRALGFLCGTLFQDSSYRLPPELLNRAMPDHHLHWGNEGMGSRLDLPLHEYILRTQTPSLERLTSPELLARLMDAERSQPPGADVLTAAELLRTLTDRLFDELDVAPEGAGFTDRAPYVSSMRRNLQRHLVVRLLELVELSRESPSDAGALARAQLAALLERLQARRKASGRMDMLSRGHLADLAARIAPVLRAERGRTGL